MLRTSPLSIVSVVVGMVLSSVACAPIYPQVSVTTLGVADPEADEEIAKNTKKAFSDTSIRKDDEYIVFANTLPRGFAYHDGVLSVEEGFSHKVQASFELGNLSGLRIHHALAGFFPYEAGWRRGLCYPQVPLQWLTLGAWSLVPTDYPCHPEPTRKKASLVQDVRVLIKKAGGDAAILGYTRESQTRAVGVRGFIVSLDPRVRGEDGKVESSPASISDK